MAHRPVWGLRIEGFVGTVSINLICDIDIGLHVPCLVCQLDGLCEKKLG